MIAIMKKFVFFMLFFSEHLISKELTLKCENGYYYKINYNDKSNITSFYKSKNNWVEVKNFELSNDKIELFIAYQQYKPCDDYSLPICQFSILISNITTNRPMTSEKILNNCFIGTMGCNEYKKGLRLNQSYCTKYNK